MSKISLIVGIITIFFVSLVTLSLIFPSLFSSIFGKFSSNLSPFEIGILGIPVILSNIILLSFGMMYYKEKLPSNISNTINKIRTFEISKKQSSIVLIVILSIYIGMSIPELSLNESEQWPDYEILEAALEIWPDGTSENIFVEEQNDRYVRMFLLDASINIFQNIKILPFLGSILVIVVSYLLTTQITKKRLSGIISIIVIISSHTFLRFDTVAIYENFWVLFYLLSLYVIKKQWIISPFLFILSFFTKAFVAPFLIMTLFFTSQTSISIKKKLGVLLSYIIIIGLAAFVIFSGDTLYPSIIQVDSDKFFLGLATFGPLLRFDFLLLFTIMPVVIGLTLMKNDSEKNTSSLLFLILGSLISGPILITFTNFYEILPYRYIPLIIFFSIGIGMFFSKKANS